jgi:hypothetical protein
MFSHKSKIFRNIFIFILTSFLLVFGSCKNFSVKKESGVRKQSVKKSVKKESDKKILPENIPDDGYIRLILNEKTGCFTLFYLADPKKMHYEPLFNSNDTSASFLSVSVDGEIYQLGSSKKFKTRIERNKKDMAFIFESSFLRVTQVFSPVKTSSSKMANGVKVTMSIQNIGTERSFVGLRMLIDTDLDEKSKNTPILTNTQLVTSELLIEGNSVDRFWISRGDKISLMGSIINPVEGVGKGPDLVHIANWKRLRDTPWRLNYSKGRAFNNMAYSANDSAVCYYFGPEMLDRNKILTYTVFLTTEDIAWYKLTEPPVNMTASLIPDKTESQVVQPKKEPLPDGLTIDFPAIEAQAILEAAATNKDEKVIIFLKLQEILNQFVEGQIKINERDLMEIEKFIEKYRIRNETY